MLICSFFRRTDCDFPAVSGLVLDRRWTDENLALNVNFSMGRPSGSVLDLVLGPVLDLRSVLGFVLDPLLGSVLDFVLGPKLRPH